MELQSKYLNGVWADKGQGQYGDYWKLHITNRDAFLQEIMRFPVNEKGGLRFTLSPQKDPAKGSISFYDEKEAAAKRQQPTGTNYKPSTPAYKPKYEKQPVDDSDDLPF